MTFKERILSVDFLRGLTVAFMILVNNPGSWEHIYTPLEHAEWNGCTLADLVFPFFLFIVGISINYALGNFTLPGADKSKATKRIFKRGVTLIVLGILLNSFPFYDFSGERSFTDLLETFRIMGVLQRIGIVFIAAALLYVYTSPRTQLITALALLIGYWILMTMVPVPGQGYAGLEAQTNLSGYIDRMILGNHIWIWSREWGDPEGLLSTLPAIASGIAGVLTGHLMKSSIDSTKKISTLLLYGIGLVAAGLVFSFVFPINKSLWTSTYVLFTTGLAIIMLAGCYFVIDVKGYTQLNKPFLAFGSNAMSAYLISEAAARLFDVLPVPGSDLSLKEILYNGLHSLITHPEFCSLVFAILWVAMIFIPIWILFRKKIFIKV